MANEILQTPLLYTPVVFADATDFDDVPYAQSIQCDFAALGIGDSRESVKADMLLDAAHMPQRWAVLCAFEHGDAPTAGDTVDVYWAASPHATAATQNPYLITGADAEIATPSASFLGQLQFIGSVPLTAVADVVHQKTFITTIPLRYGSVLVFNNSSAAFEASANKCQVAFIPLIDEAQ